MEKFLNKRKGVTLIELLLTLALLSMVIQVIYSVFFVGKQSFDTSVNIGFAQQDARLPVDYINKEIRTASKVYLEEPTLEVLQIENPAVSIYYSLTMNDQSQLIKTTYNLTAEPIEGPSQIISSGIETIEFIPIITIISEVVTVDYNIIDLVVTSVEGRGSKEFTKEFTTLIRFENSKDREVINYKVVDGSVVLPENKITMVYYTKY